MRIVQSYPFNVLIPSKEENVLIAKIDLEKREEEKYYFKYTTIPQSVTLDECKELYVEIPGNLSSFSESEEVKRKFRSFYTS